MWPGHRMVRLTFRVSRLTELRKCLSVSPVWSRDRWWSLEEGKFTRSPRAGGREAELSRPCFWWSEGLQAPVLVHLDFSKEAGPCELTVPSEVVRHSPVSLSLLVGSALGSKAYSLQ